MKPVIKKSISFLKHILFDYRCRLDIIQNIKRIIYGILAYMLVSVIKNVKLMNILIFAHV